jgi:hypothetical protein
MSRVRLSFPVSYSQEKGKRETGGKALTEKDLQFPKTVTQKALYGKLKSSRSRVPSSNGAELRTGAPLLKIDRLYNARAAALDALVDVLRQLLVDGSESPIIPSLVEHEPTCFPRPPE